MSSIRQGMENSAMELWKLLETMELEACDKDPEADQENSIITTGETVENIEDNVKGEGEKKDEEISEQAMKREADDRQTKHY